MKPSTLFVSLYLGLFTTAVWAALKPGDAAPDFTVDAVLGGKEFKFSLAEALKKGSGGTLLLSQIVHERLHGRGA